MNAEQRSNFVDDGENQAVRDFLALYGANSSVSIIQMRNHLARSGWDGCWPEWVSTGRLQDRQLHEMHLTKSGAQDWIRHLFALEAVPLPVAVVDDLYILSMNEEPMEEAIDRFKGSSTGEALKAVFGAQKSLRARLMAPDAGETLAPADVAFNESRERSAFEAWVSDGVRARKLPLGRHANGAYSSVNTYQVWYGWQARGRHYVVQMAACDAAALELTGLKKEVSALKEEVTTWKRSAEMYANAWQRELLAFDGKIRNKRHHIDAMVLSTRDLVALAKKASVDAKEALRYRWLRDKSDPGICAFYLSVGKAFHGIKFNQETVDQAIDAQIAATAQDPEGS